MYTVTAKEQVFLSPACIQILSMAFCGQNSAVKDSEGRSKAGFDFDEEDFPLATYPREGADPKVPAREIPLPMMAFAAASVGVHSYLPCYYLLMLRS